MNLRFWATSTSSTRSGWLRKRIDLGPNRAQTRSPYWRCQRVSAPRRSRLNSRRFPESQCCRGPGGRSTFVLMLVFVLMLIFLKLSLLNALAAVAESITVIHRSITALYRARQVTRARSFRRHLGNAKLTFEDKLKTD